MKQAIQRVRVPCGLGSMYAHTADMLVMELSCDTYGLMSAEVCVGAAVKMSHLFRSFLRYVHGWDKYVLAHTTDKLSWAWALRSVNAALTLCPLGCVSAEMFV